MEREKAMVLALALARKAGEAGEIPVGCVVVQGNRVIGEGYNRREECHSPLAHAEIMAISQACQTLGDWRLDDCGLVVTLEPCPMCAGAILNARLKWVCFGASEHKTGSCGSVINLFEENYGYHPTVYGGVLEEECADLMRQFFTGLR